MIITGDKENLTKSEEIDMVNSLNDARDNNDDRKFKYILDKIVTKNVGLVHKHAQAFPIKNQNISYDDLFQEGMRGLIHGICKFDTTKGYRLSTYVYRWIGVYMQRAFQNQGRSIRIPAHLSEKYYKVRRQIEELTTALGRTPTPDEIDEISPDASRIGNIFASISSLNSCINDSGDEMIDIQPDNSYDFYDKLHIDCLLASLRKQSSERDYDILVRRFGVDGYSCEALATIAERHSLSRARVSQIEHSMLNKLRAIA